MSVERFEKEVLEAGGELAVVERGEPYQPSQWVINAAYDVEVQYVRRRGVEIWMGTGTRLTFSPNQYERGATEVLAHCGDLLNQFVRALKVMGAEVEGTFHSKDDSKETLISVNGSICRATCINSTEYSIQNQSLTPYNFWDVARYLVRAASDEEPEEESETPELTFMEELVSEGYVPEDLDVEVEESTDYIQWSLPNSTAFVTAQRGVDLLREIRVELHYQSPQDVSTSTNSNEVSYQGGALRSYLEWLKTFKDGFEGADPLTHDTLGFMLGFLEGRHLKKDTVFVADRTFGVEGAKMAFLLGLPLDAVAPRTVLDDKELMELFSQNPDFFDELVRKGYKNEKLVKRLRDLVAFLTAGEEAKPGAFWSLLDED